MFADAEELKREVHKNLFEEVYSVEQLYKDDGTCQEIARHPWFEYITFAAIIIYGVWIGVELDQNPAETLLEASAVFHVVENLFCVFFTFEILVRLGAFRHKWDACRDSNFVLDCALCGLMLFETWVGYILAAFQLHVVNGGSFGFVLRILRLTRVCRLARLLRSLPELIVLFKGLRAAARSVGWTMGLLALIIYVFAVLFRILTKDTDIGKLYFGSISDGMATLLLPGLLPDSAETVFTMGQEGSGYAVVFVTFVIIGTVVVMNLLIGMMCQSVNVVASVEQEEVVVSYVTSELGSLMITLDKDVNGVLSKHELERILLNRSACKVISEVGVDVESLVDVAAIHLFSEKDEITFAEFVQLVLQLRGTNGSSVRDIVNLRKFILEEMYDQEDRILYAISRAFPLRSPVESMPLTS